MCLNYIWKGGTKRRKFAKTEPEVDPPGRHTWYVHSTVMGFIGVT
jgi:hypothetical protein